MGSFKELGEFLRDAKGTITEIKRTTNDIKGNSLAKRSSAATMQFPVIMSRSINVDTASNVVKALERQYAVFVQLVISLNPILDLNKYEDVGDFINSLHQNNPTPIDIIESCINVYSDEAIGMRMILSLNEGCSGQVLNSNKQQLICIEDHLNQNKINDLYKPTQITLEQAGASLDYFLLHEAKNRDKNDNIEIKQEEVNYKKQQDLLNNLRKSKEFKYKKLQDELNRNDKKQRFDYEKEQDKQKQEMEKAKLKLEIEKTRAEQRSRTIVKLSDTDVKKCNELVPTTLSVTVQQIKGDNFGGNINFVLGVKGVMHPVNSEEMVSNLLDGYKSGNKFFNFLRWTSGEISFVKDLLFNVNGIKEDVIKKHTKGSHWWTTLKRNRTMARIKNTYGKNRILPNATIVCSMEEIMEINDTYNVDLLNPRHTVKLMDRYFLIGFVIVDESQELAYFMFDGENEFQALSFKGLERENNNKNDFKDIYKMINNGRL